MSSLNEKKVVTPNEAELILRACVSFASESSSIIEHLHSCDSVHVINGVSAREDTTTK